jgi:uncharacterized protein YajQ (UPF0234 family)
MPSFDVVSEVDLQEVRNAVDQTAREVGTRYDFKGTESVVEFDGKEKININSASEDRVKAIISVLEEKFVKRQISLKSLDHGTGEEAAGARYKQELKLRMGLSTEKAKEIGKYIKEHGPKGAQHQIQGDQLRVSSKKRDDLQSIISMLSEHNFEIPLQFENFRD